MGVYAVYANHLSKAKDMKTKANTAKRTNKSASRGKIKSRNNAKEAIMLTALTIGATGILGYLGWQYIKRRRQRGKLNLDETMLNNGTMNPIANSNSSSSIIDNLSPLPGTSIALPNIEDTIINKILSFKYLLPPTVVYTQVILSYAFTI